MPNYAQPICCSLLPLRLPVKFSQLFSAFTMFFDRSRQGRLDFPVRHYTTCCHLPVHRRLPFLESQYDLVDSTKRRPLSQMQDAAVDSLLANVRQLKVDRVFLQQMPYQWRLPQLRRDCGSVNKRTTRKNRCMPPYTSLLVIK